MRCNPLPRLFLAFLVFALGISSASAAVQDRITAAVSDSSRVAIPGSIHPKVGLATDLGPAPANLKMVGMTVRFSLTTAQQAALDQLLIGQQNPSSPQYHQWLTPAQYAAQFGLSSGDIAQVTAWLTSQGFSIDEVAKSATFVRFSGTAAQVNAAFGASIHTLSLNGESHFANVTEPSVPSAFANVVMGFTGLHDFRLKARVRTTHPQFTSSVSGAHYVEPGDFYQIYNELPAFAGGFTGAGQTIAVMGQVDLYPNTQFTTTQTFPDIVAFRSAAGLPASVPTVTTYGNNPGPALCSSCTNEPSDDDLSESSLDVEWAGATAPAASIIFVNSIDVFALSLTDAIDNNIAPIMSVSYGDCEQAWGTTELNTLNQLFKLGNSMGITIVGPGGDSGATDCDAGPSATQGLGVDFPASSPYVTGMGGTQYNEGSTNYWLAGEQTNTVGGTSVAAGAYYSAESYIPEAVWNDSYVGDFGGGGGGQSLFFPKPYWQVGTGVPNDASRDVPDLALDSSDVHDGLLYCFAASCAVGFRETANGTLTVAGGTSFATPTFAGILALVEQKTGSRIGNANPTIYALGGSKYYVAGANFAANSSVVFNDVTTGNNDSACTQGTYNCPNGGSIGYNAGTGYDLATGWGSVNVANLVNDWKAVTPIAASGPTGGDASSTAVTVSPASVTANAVVTLTATVSSATTGVTTTPTGTVQFLVNNTVVGSGAVGAGTGSGSGVATYSWTTGCSTLGQQVISASYSGDGTYTGSKGAGITAIGFTTTANSVVTPVTVQVSSGSCPTFTLTTPSSTVSVASGGTPVATITAASVNGLAGTVTFTATAIENTVYTPTISLSPSSVTLTASGSGATQTTTLTLNGVTSKLRLPGMPGRVDPGTVLARQSGHRVPWYGAGPGVAIASLLLLMLPRRRRLGSLLLLALSIAIAAGASGCGSGANGTIAAGQGDQFAGTYVVTVVGTYTSGSVSISQTVPVTFVIQ
jgi:subtilase family serine protease